MQEETVTNQIPPMPVEGTQTNPMPAPIQPVVPPTPMPQPTQTPPPQEPVYNASNDQPQNTPKKKFPILWIIVAIIFLILITVGGFFAYTKLQSAKVTNTQTEVVVTESPMPTFSPISSPTPIVTGSGIPTPTGSSNPSISFGNQGLISGTICYPSSGVPAGKVYAKEVNTNQIVTFQNSNGVSSFQINLDAGSYKLKYVPDNTSLVTGYYTACTGNEPVCQSTAKRSSIVTTVTKGQTSEGIKICDYYYTKGNDPDF